MGKNVLIIAIVVVAAYIVGVEAGRSRGKDYEDLRHQIERLWTSPEAQKSRKRAAKKIKKAVEEAGRRRRRALR
ncbi:MULTISPECIES: hypothetical protein [Microbacterium]|uniref:YtxH domain-containing protein n=1 Tax=Microbacterium resistens TaxID=156977 RepID=A0ABY3RMX3_9MICO|nr:hypothetical protein [Microbacterium resistens]MBW1639305.1 hypothetical protein [Microbacterium resistens]MDA4894759.1 hypothetical protein [Streptomyces sp. MS2A]UGS24996.1 hypothetical protein K8F61_09765 [Microbacterium resistens]